MNVGFFQSDTLFAANPDPWAHYANINLAHSKETLSAITDTSILLKAARPTFVGVALAATTDKGFIVSPAATETNTEPTQLTQRYVVQQGDTLSSIAANFNLHTASILAANEIPPDPAVINSIRTGDLLTIPPRDISDSTAWLDAINAANAAAAKLAATQAAQLAQHATTTRRSSAGGSVTSAGGSHPHSGTYTYGYCTDLVAALRPDLPSNLGNAGTWVRQARAQGFATGRTPQVNAAVQLAEGYVGHVALVTGVGNGTITIRERNYAGWNVDDYRTLSSSSGEIVGYIY